MEILDFLKDAWWISSVLVGLLWIYIKLSFSNQISASENRMKDRMDSGFAAIHKDLAELAQQVAFLRGKSNHAQK